MTEHHQGGVLAGVDQDVHPLAAAYHLLHLALETAVQGDAVRLVEDPLTDLVEGLDTDQRKHRRHRHQLGLGVHQPQPRTGPGGLGHGVAHRTQGLVGAVDTDDEDRLVVHGSSGTGARRVLGRGRERFRTDRTGRR